MKIKERERERRAGVAAPSTRLHSLCLTALALLFMGAACSTGAGSGEGDAASEDSVSDDGYAVSGMIDSHYYVDLGLSVKWADRNIGAESSEAYGDYFAWGETQAKTSYTEKNCATYGDTIKQESIASDATYDAATANWGSNWRMPTKTECDELCNACVWKWTTRKGHCGYLVTGPNGNSIFLPAGGDRVGTSLNYAGERGRYWASTPRGKDEPQHAYGLYFGSSYQRVGWYERYDGRSVRPVTK